MSIICAQLICETKQQQNNKLFVARFYFLNYKTLVPIKMDRNSRFYAVKTVFYGNQFMFFMATYLCFSLIKSFFGSNSNMFTVFNSNHKKIVFFFIFKFFMSQFILLLFLLILNL